MDSPFPWTSLQVQIDLAVSTSLMNAGRLEEAIQLRNNRLELASGSWPRHQRVLDTWRKDPRMVAWCYAREGFQRGEDARAVEGFSRIEPGDGVDLGMFLDALVATGREREVPLAYAQFGLGRRLLTPYARLKAARALMCAGEWRRGLEELFTFELQSPTRDDHAAVAHAARLLACAPHEVLEEAVAERLSLGARTLARRLARTIADFVPEPPDAVVEALGQPTPLDFDGAWLKFPEDTRSRAAIDALFAECEDDLAGADHLVNRWNQVVFVGASDEDKGGLAQATAYVAAQALLRYLALATQPPSVLAGACRTVAAEAMLALRGLREELRNEDRDALVRSLEPVAALGEEWLAALDRALQLDEALDGRLPACFVGPEQLATLGVQATQLVREGKLAEAEPVLARLVRLTGTTGIDEWSRAIDAAGLDPDDALDAHLTCAAYARGRKRA
jgi:hypothetical protein